MISAILLAAGKSERMNGENKLIKKIQGVPTIKHSINNMFISNIVWTKNIAANWPNIAIHLILIKFVSNIVFTNLKFKCLD